MGSAAAQSADCIHQPTKAIAAAGRGGRGSPPQEAGLEPRLITDQNDATSKSSDEHDCQQNGIPQEPPGAPALAPGKKRATRTLQRNPARGS